MGAATRAGVIPAGQPERGPALTPRAREQSMPMKRRPNGAADWNERVPATRGRFRLEKLP